MALPLRPALVFLTLLGLGSVAAPAVAQSVEAPATTQPAPTRVALRLAGSTPPWVEGVQFNALPPEAAFRELYGGRVDGVLGTLPGPPPPPGVGAVISAPVGVFAVSVLYALPGVAPPREGLRLDLPTLCLMLAGQITVWNHARLRTLNPETTLPDLPVLVSARVARNGVSLAVAGACVKTGTWPPSWLKSNWVAGASLTRAALGSQRGDLALPGVLMVLGPRDLPRPLPTGVGVAQLRSPGGTFVGPEAVGLGVAALSVPAARPPLPSRPFGPLPPISEPGSYPLRGLVWLSVLREQAYRGRTPAQARALAGLAAQLQAADTAGRGFVGLPLNLRPPLPLTYGGRGLDALEPGSTAPASSVSSSVRP